MSDDYQDRLTWGWRADVHEIGGFHFRVVISSIIIIWSLNCRGGGSDRGKDLIAIPSLLDVGE